MLIESSDVHECLDKIVKEINDTGRLFSQFDEVVGILCRLRDELIAIEAKYAGNNVLYKYNQALYALKDK